jgi:hypothetical protein
MSDWVRNSVCSKRRMRRTSRRINSQFPGRARRMHYAVRSFYGTTDIGILGLIRSAYNKGQQTSEAQKSFIPLSLCEAR